MKLDASQSRAVDSNGLFKRIRDSVFPDPLIPVTDADRRRYLRRNLILHFRPSEVPAKTLAFSLTWGLGGMAAVLVVIQLASGILLKFAYEPSPAGAYASIQTLIADVPFGQFVRNIHHWSANLLVAIMFLHMLRVFFTGGFYPPRQFNWIIGLAMFGVALIANFTGYLLPWDQLAYWAVTVSTGMLGYIPWIGTMLQNAVRGGTDLGPGTLRIFFAVHSAVVPIVIAALMAFHFWRVRKAGGLVIPRGPGEDPDEQPMRVAVLPNLLVREAAMASVVTAAVLMISVFFNAPLEGPANPGLSPNPTKAPWYFAGLQELLLHLHPLFAVCIIPVVVVIALVAIPYLTYQTSPGGIWFASRTGRRTVILAAATALIFTPLLVVFDDLLVEPGRWFPALPAVIVNGVIPVAFLLAGVAGFCLFLKRRASISKNEAIQAVFALLVTAFLVLTVIGVWFRGKGMALTWPW